MRLSLGQVFAAAALGCSALVGVALWLFLHDLEAATLQASSRSRHVVARSVEAEVSTALSVAKDTLLDIENAFTSGAVSSRDPLAVEALLHTQLLAAHHVAEASFTRNEGRMQTSVLWTALGQLETEVTAPEGESFVTRQWLRAVGDTRFRRDQQPARMAASDPTQHLTYLASIAPEQRGELVWSDLHYAESDRGSATPRVVLTVQKAVRDVDGAVVGVARVGLATDALDAITQRRGVDADDPHRIALLAASMAPGAPARLVTKIGAGDTVAVFDDELRVAPREPPPDVAALIESPLLDNLGGDCVAREGRLQVNGEPWLATLSALSIAGGGTAGWFVAVLVPESHYTRDVVGLAHGLLGVFLFTLMLVLGIGFGVLWVVRRGVRAAASRAQRMRRFDFAPDPGQSWLADTDELLQGIERAKTVARAMCKYIPVTLVRGLYERNHEPQLGGELRDVTLMFSDIQGFTSLSERLEPAELATLLGHYFEVMTTALAESGATIDKYIGDAVMAFWNAPEATTDHAQAACRGVLRCKQALAALYASAPWGGRPPLVTRFGLHRASVLVGHFGATSRLAYTALGDGVNLAARLESSCKQYDVTVLVSSSVADSARDEFEFRAVDRLTVRGKTEPVDVFELLGPAASEVRL